MGVESTRPLNGVFTKVFNTLNHSSLILGPPPHQRGGDLRNATRCVMASKGGARRRAWVHVNSPGGVAAVKTGHCVELALCRAPFRENTYHGECSGP